MWMFVDVADDKRVDDRIDCSFPATHPGLGVCVFRLVSIAMYLFHVDLGLNRSRGNEVPREELGSG